MNTVGSSFGHLSWKGKFVDLFLVYLLVASTGGLLFRAFEKPALLAMTLLGCAILIVKVKVIRPFFLLYAICMLIFLLAIGAYTAFSLSITSIVGVVLKLVFAYAVIAYVGRRFVDTYIVVMTFLAAISLFGYFTDLTGILDGMIRRLPNLISGQVYEGIFYAYKYRVQIGRNNSIFYEPGVYQFFINVALFMIFFASPSLSRRRLHWAAAILAVTLFTTFSTTGYLIFLIMVAVMLMKSSFLTKNQKAGLLVGGGLATAVLAAPFQAVIIDKIDRYLSIRDITDTRDRRSMDLFVDLEIIKRDVFGHGHEKYKSHFVSIGLVPEEGASSSNGLTKLAAVYGLPFSAFLLGSYLTFCLRCVEGRATQLAAFGCLCMFFYTQDLTLQPATLAMIAAIFFLGPRRTREFGADPSEKSDYA